MKLYVAQVRSASVESPSAKDINYLETVQKFGLLDFYNYHHCRTGGQLFLCLCTFYCIVINRTCVFPK